MNQLGVGAERRLWLSNVAFAALVSAVALIFHFSWLALTVYLAAALGFALWNYFFFRISTGASPGGIQILRLPGNLALASVLVLLTGGIESPAWPLFLIALTPTRFQARSDLLWAPLAVLASYAATAAAVAPLDRETLARLALRLVIFASWARVLHTVLSREQKMETDTGRHQAALNETIRLLEDKLAERSSKLHAFAVELIRAEEEQRARIARELHDGLGQLMTAVNIELQVLYESAPDSLKVRVDDVRALASQVSLEMRRISQELRPAVLDEMGLTEAVRALVGRMGRHTNIALDLKIDGTVDVLPADSAIACYRLVQEALNNVVRHSGARRARIELIRRDERLAIAVVDDGKGIDYDPSLQDGHFGLMGLQERIKALGGTLGFGRTDEGGTRIEAELPMTSPM